MQKYILLVPAGVLLALALASCSDSTSPTCGDGTPAGEAQCAQLCGDGRLDSGEQCDDGNREDGDGCDSDCVPTMPVCGNGLIEAGEGCDDGNQIGYDGCERDCTVSSVTFHQCPGADLAPLASGTCEVTSGDGARLITGDVLTPEAVYTGGQVLFDAAGIIQCVGCDCSGESGAAAATKLVCPGAVISPGLINSHDHITFHDEPYVSSSGERYEHRHDWRRGNNGHTYVPAGDAGYFAAIQWNELRQVMAGTTSVAGSGGVSGLLRNLDRDSAGGANTEGLNGPIALYDTFPLGDNRGSDNGLELADGCGYPSLVAGTPPGSPADGGAWLPHVSEGIEGSARNEFLCLSNVGAGAYDVLDGKTAIIHGIGVRAADVARMSLLDTSLIWSPRSNIYLYGDTAPISTYKRYGMNIALGTDWLRSGSMNILRELRCADSFSDSHFGGLLRDDELWLMVTAKAAKAVGFDGQIGILAPGNVADIAIFNKGAAATPYRVIVEAQPQDVVLTIRGGAVLFGDQVLVDALADQSCDALPVCGVDKAVCVSAELGKPLATLQSENASTYPLFFCEEPLNEPSCTPSRSAPWAVNGSSVYTGAATDSDTDGDGVPDLMDNCPGAFNPIRPLDDGWQADNDGDGVGDVCDVCPLDASSTTCSPVVYGDADADGLLDEEDNCPSQPNPEQLDMDTDGTGDACDWCPRSNPGNGACAVTIYDIKAPVGGVYRYLQRPVSLDGVQVTAVSPGTGFFVQVPASAPEFAGPDYAGLYVYAPQADVARGDLVAFEGMASSFFGQIQVNGVNSVSVSASGRAELEPVPVAAADIATGGARASALEGALVQVTGAMVTALEPPAGPGDRSPTYEFVLADSLRVNDFLHRISPFPVVGEQLSSLTGVVNYRNGDFKLEPRDEQDVVFGAPLLVALGPTGTYLREGEIGATTFPEVVTLSVSRPVSADTFVAVTSSAPAQLAVDGGGVTMLAGQSSAPVLLSALARSPAVTLTAGAGMLTAQVRVLAVDEQVGLLALTAAEPVVLPGGSVELTVTLDLPPAVDTAVSLRLEPPDAGTVPATVVVPANQLSATFTYGDASIAESVQVTAILDGASLSQTLTIQAVCEPSAMVISQVYGGGGNSGSTYTHDFIELHNRSALSRAIGGWSVQYASSSGTSWSQTDIPAGTVVPPGGYFLIQQAQGGGGTTALPTPDLVGTLAMGGSSGKVALVRNQMALTGTGCPLADEASVVDYVGYGGANCFEGTGATPNSSGANSVQRAADGCQDTTDNAADFTAAPAAPRNAAAAALTCGCD